jgi:thiol:disulfide interchange protein DsbC
MVAGKEEGCYGRDQALSNRWKRAAKTCRSGRERVSVWSSAALIGVALATHAYGGEAEIRKNLSERLGEKAKIDEISATPVPGLFEVRLGTDILYSDERGDYILRGELLDTKARTNLTEARLNKLRAIDFASLPLNDAVVWKNGNGKRKIAVFADPNCGYCKRFERTLQDVKDVTVYTFVIPILGGDSPQKARAIWCAQDKTEAWRSWMLGTKAPQPASAECESSAISRNAALAAKSHVTGTPTIVFEDGSTAPGAMPREQLETRLRGELLGAKAKANLIGVGSNDR